MAPHKKPTSFEEFAFTKCFGFRFVFQVRQLFLKRTKNLMDVSDLKNKKYISKNASYFNHKCTCAKTGCKIFFYRLKTPFDCDKINSSLFVLQ